MLNKWPFRLTVIAVFEKIVSIIIIVLLSRLDLFRRDVLLHVWNRNYDQHFKFFCGHHAVFFEGNLVVKKKKKKILTGSSLASLLTMLSR